MRRIEETDKVIPLLRSGRIYSKLAIAASIAAVFALSIGFLGSETVENSSDSVLAHELPDGSTIHLSPDAELNYNDLTWPLFRDLDFSGTGFFEVEKGSKFSVTTDLGKVSVLGTSFSVITKNKNLRVSCKTGKVLVENGNDLSMMLTPGKGVKMSESKAEEFSLDSEIVDAWVDGTYRFDNVNIDQVLNSIEDFTRFQVEYPEGLSASYSGEFSTDQSIEEILDIVCKPLGLSYEINEKKSLIRISNK
ncbi:MAG TPA: FecR family protein [Cryomorphaceae bacterium]|nr:FecR family protein [Cryomorphaceae bacterium]